MIFGQKAIFIRKYNEYIYIHAFFQKKYMKLYPGAKHSLGYTLGCVNVCCGNKLCSEHQRFSA